MPTLRELGDALRDSYTEPLREMLNQTNILRDHFNQAVPSPQPVLPIDEVDEWWTRPPKAKKFYCNDCGKEDKKGRMKCSKCHSRDIRVEERAPTVVPTPVLNTTDGTTTTQWDYTWNTTAGSSNFISLDLPEPGSTIVYTDDDEIPF